MTKKHVTFVSESVVPLWRILSYHYQIQLHSAFGHLARSVYLLSLLLEALFWLSVVSGFPVQYMRALG